MKLVKFTYEYGHRVRHSSANGSYLSDPVRAIEDRYYVMENAHQIHIDMLWLYIADERRTWGDDMYQPVKAEVMPFDIAGLFKPPIYRP